MQRAASFVDGFVKDVAAAISPLMPSSAVCMDWSLRYAGLFAPCQRLYDYQYNAGVSSFAPARPGAHGVVGGDLANITHVPSDLSLDLVLATEVCGSA